MAQQNPWDAAPIVSRSRENAQATNPWDSAPVVVEAAVTEPARQVQPSQPPSPAYTPTRQFRSPVSGIQVSAFGQREAPKAGASTNHQGIDLRAAVGEPVSAAGDGEVIFAGPRGNYGNRVVIRHSDGTETTYSHLSNIGVQVGQRLAAGSPVGAAGATGNVTGPHVHFEVMRDGQYVDPNDWLMGPEDIAAEEVVTPDEAVVAVEEEPALAEAPTLGTRENPVDITNREQVQLAKKGDWVRLANGDLTQAAGEAVQGDVGTQQAPGIFTRESNLVDAIGAGATAAGEQIPFLDEAAAGVVGLTSGLGYDAIRDRQQAIQQADNQQYRPARVTGGIAGFGAGLAAPGGAYIRGATGLGRVARAAQVGAGYGALYGGGAADDTYASRLSGIAQGAAIGAGTGGLFQMGADRLGRLAQEAVDRAPSQARILSREGVDLTPGMMAAEIPVIGNTIRSLEEGASSIPFVGQPIAGARQQAVESFSNAAVNRALRPIGERLPREVSAGYDAVDYAQQAFGRAYDTALRDVTMAVDQSVIDRIGEALVRVADEAGEPQARALTNAIRNRVFRGLDEVGQTIDGQQFKALESELGNLAREAAGASDGATRTLGTAYGDVQRILREALMEQNPQAATQLQRVNQGYATMARINDAASSTAAFADDGVFTPTQLGRAVSRGGSTNQLARGEALLQDLAVAGRGIIPSRVGDSGTATRGAVTGGLAALASGTPLVGSLVGPLAAPVIATSIAYSRPAQQALNAIYRASDSPGAAQRHLRRLANLAQREPALQPYYQEAVRFVSGQEPLRPQQPDARSRMREERLAG